MKILSTRFGTPAVFSDTPFHNTRLQKQSNITDAVSTDRDRVIQNPKKTEIHSHPAGKTTTTPSPLKNLQKSIKKSVKKVATGVSLGLALGACNPEPIEPANQAPQITNLRLIKGLTSDMPTGTAVLTFSTTGVDGNVEAVQIEKGHDKFTEKFDSETNEGKIVTKTGATLDSFEDISFRVMDDDGTMSALQTAEISVVTEPKAPEIISLIPGIDTLANGEPFAIRAANGDTLIYQPPFEKASKPSSTNTPIKATLPPWNQRSMGLILMEKCPPTPTANQ